MRDDIARASSSFFFVALFLFIVAAFSYYSPLGLRPDTPWQEIALRAAAHFLPALLPLVVGVALRYSQQWAWYLGAVCMITMFGLGVYLSMEHFVYLLSGHLVPPTFLLLSVISMPSLYFLFRGKMELRRQLRRQDR